MVRRYLIPTLARDYIHPFALLKKYLAGKGFETNANKLATETCQPFIYSATCIGGMVEQKHKWQ
jgi:hypothetical protein